MHTLMRDIQYGIRMMRRTPAFSAIALLTIALVIGANTAIFSVVNAAMIRPLPFQNAGRLMRIFHSYSHIDLARASVSPHGYQYYRDHNRAFENVVALTTSKVPVNLTSGGVPERISAYKTTANLFATFGAQPLLGRTFGKDDDQAGRDRVVVLAYGLWQGRFSGDPNIIGRDINLDRQNYTVVGVMPKSFDFPGKVEAWVPMAFTPEQLNSDNEYLGVVAKLKPDVSIAQAKADMARMSDELLRITKDPNTEGWSATTLPMQASDTADLKTALWTLLAAVLAVLLIAAANLANLMLARAVSRQREMAIRTALGASRVRIVRQMLTEGMLLAVGGGVLGIAFGYLALRNLLAFMPVSLPSYVHVSIDRNVLLFTAALVTLTGVVFSVVPALRITIESLSETLKTGSSRETSRSGLRSTIVVGEFALALTLPVTAGLLIRTFVAIQNSNPGFEPRNVMTGMVALPPANYKPAAVAGFCQQLIERLQAAPGVRHAAIASELPLDSQWTQSFIIQGKQFTPSPHAHAAVISDDYFAAMSIPLKRGRAFAATDTAEAPLVAILDEKAVAAYFGAEDPLGKHIVLTSSPMDKPEWREVVGVVGSVKHNSPLENETKGEMFFPIDQMPQNNLFVAVQTEGNASGTAAIIRNELRALDPALPLYRVKTMDVALDEFVAQPRFNMMLIAAFAALAMLLASIGIYGVVAYTVTQRTQEIGVRMALGAQRGDVLRMILTYGLRMAATGVGIGLVASVFVAHLVASMLFGIRPSDPVTLVTVSAVLTATALLASYVPAWRATRVDPAITLRQQ